MDAARMIIRQHAEALRVKRLQKRRHDDYGNIVDDKWMKEKVYFYENVILPTLRASYGTEWFGFVSTVGSHLDIEVKGVPRNQILMSILDAEIDVYERSTPISSENASSLSPTAFEAYCVQLLVNSGWQATTTKASGDQGIDILATRDGLKAVFQCKKLSTPVGNKAVQEAIAGKSFASADYAFVVSNIDFTPSARELAAKSGVHLLHYSSLSNLDRYLESQ
jgi:restriction system protein